MNGEDSIAPPEPGAEDLAGRLVSLPELADRWEELALPAGRTLFERGAEGDAFYTVLEGRLEVHSTDENGRKMVLEQLGAGQHLGELALVLDDRRAASVTALTDCRLKRLSREAYRDSLPTIPALSAATIEMLGTRLKRTGSYLDLVTRWANLVAKGDYDGAQSAIRSRVAEAEDKNLERFVNTFNDMVASVKAREEALARQLSQLKIEIDHQQLRTRLAEVTETDFFKNLQARAGDMRHRVRGASPPSDVPDPTPRDTDPP
jgi:CRP-like cAMP-binding protein